jgi:hypothetical protein
MDIMPIHNIDDWEMRIKRQNAFWDKEILDRPVVCIEIPNPKTINQLPISTHTSLTERWTDISYQADTALKKVKNIIYMGDALPIACPNLGPNFFCACFGGTLQFQDETSYIEPFLSKWSNFTNLSFNKKNEYFLIMEDLYSAFLDAGQGEFYTGWPDIHTGADALVGFRGPMKMNYDVIDNRDEIVNALIDIMRDFFSLYNHYFDKLSSKQQPITGWPGIVSNRKWHVPSNDFSCMISNTMFEEIFLDPLVEEMKHMENNLYHLDGPGALTHLDTLLAIKELDAIQWVYGAGNGRASDHIPIYQKIQSAGKGIQMTEVFPDEIETITSHLSPEGVWMKVQAATIDEAEYVVKKIDSWGVKQK